MPNPNPNQVWKDKLEAELAAAQHMLDAEEVKRTLTLALTITRTPTLTRTLIRTRTRNLTRLRHCRARCPRWRRLSAASIGPNSTPLLMRSGTSRCRQRPMRGTRTPRSQILRGNLWTASRSFSERRDTSRSRVATSRLPTPSTAETTSRRSSSEPTRRPSRPSSCRHLAAATAAFVL